MVHTCYFDNDTMVSDWLEWGPQVECSSTCDVGVAARYRNCSTGTNDDCVGNRYKLETCANAPCLGKAF